MYLKGTVLLGLVAVLVNACFQAPEFPNEPTIDFSDIIFKHGATATDHDSLILTIKFQDGDGDLGLAPDGNDTKEPYQDIIDFDHVSESRKVQYFDRKTPEYDTLPPYEFPYKCTNYIIEDTTINDIVLVDTLYIQRNEFHNNIYVTFFKKKNGEYVEFDFLYLFEPQCNTISYDGRYPVLNESNRDRPLEGLLKYTMKSAAWELVFRQDTLKLDIYIYDRALNKSNTISTPDFVLKNITVGG